MGVDIRGLFTGELSPRYALMLLEQAGHGSATDAALHGSAHRGWDVHTYLQASIVDLLAGGNYQRGGGKGRKPRPIPRPKRTARRVVRVADIIKAREARS